VADWLQQQARSDAVLALVGHLPFLDRLAACLVLDDINAQLLDFQPGALVKVLPRADQRRFVISWMLAPGVV